MTSPSATADERNTRTIHTAACLIIGDEVLGGKVSSNSMSEKIQLLICYDRLLM